MPATTHINYNGLPLAVYHSTESVNGSNCTRINAIRARAALGQHIKAGEDITDLMSIREQLDILHRALNS